jgi:hypothetical protein
VTAAPELPREHGHAVERSAVYRAQTRQREPVEPTAHTTGLATAERPAMPAGTCLPMRPAR